MQHSTRCRQQKATYSVPSQNFRVPSLTAISGHFRCYQLHTRTASCLTVQDGQLSCTVTHMMMVWSHDGGVITCRPLPPDGYVSETS